MFLIPRLYYILPLVFAGFWILILGIDPHERLNKMHQDYPLIQAYQLSSQTTDQGWINLKDSAPLTQSRFKKLIQYLVDQFDLELRQLRLEEQDVSPLKHWRVNLIVAGRTDAEIWDMQTYLKTELASLVVLRKFSLHRSGSLDESVVQQGNTPNLVEGRFELDWITR